MVPPSVHQLLRRRFLLRLLLPVLLYELPVLPADPLLPEDLVLLPVLAAKTSACLLIKILFIFVCLTVSEY
jgi:hypothetical protein